MFVLWIDYYLKKKTSIISFHSNDFLPFIESFLRCPTHSLLCPTNLSSSTVGATLRDLDVRWSCIFLYQNYVKAFLARAAPRTSEMVKTTKTSVSVSNLDTWTWTRSVASQRAATRDAECCIFLTSSIMAPAAGTGSPLVIHNRLIRWIKEEKPVGHGRKNKSCKSHRTTTNTSKAIIGGLGTGNGSGSRAHA